MRQSTNLEENEEEIVCQSTAEMVVTVITLAVTVSFEEILHVPSSDMKGKIGKMFTMRVLIFFFLFYVTANGLFPVFQYTVCFWISNTSLQQHKAFTSTK